MIVALQTAILMSIVYHLGSRAETQSSLREHGPCVITSGEKDPEWTPVLCGELSRKLRRVKGHQDDQDFQWMGQGVTPMGTEAP